MQMLSFVTPTGTARSRSRLIGAVTIGAMITATHSGNSPPRARNGICGQRPHPACSPPCVGALYEWLTRPWPQFFSHKMNMLSLTFSNGPLAPRVCGLTTSSILKLNIIDYILIVSRVLIY